MEDGEETVDQACECLMFVPGIGVDRGLFSAGPRERAERQKSGPAIPFG